MQEDVQIVFWFLFGMVITNAYILYRQASQSTQTMPLKQFRLQLADLLIGDYCSRKRPGRPYAVTKQPVPLFHMPMKRLDEEEDRRAKRSAFFDLKGRQGKTHVGRVKSAIAILMIASPCDTNRIYVKNKCILTFVILCHTFLYLPSI